MSRQRTVMRVLFLLVYMVNGAAALDCVVHVFSNGFVLYSLTEAAKPGCDVQWNTHGVVDANEEDFDRTPIIRHTNSPLLLYGYHPQTECEVNCQGWRQVVTCIGPTLELPVPYKIRHPTLKFAEPYDNSMVIAGDNSMVIAGDNSMVIAGALVSFILFLLILAICCRKKIGCFRKGKWPIGDQKDMMSLMEIQGMVSCKKRTRRSSMDHGWKPSMEDRGVQSSEGV